VITSRDLRSRRDEIFKIAALHGAKDLRIFGSVARGETTQSSDLDVLIRLEPGRSLLDLIGIKQDLEDLLGCSVDVVTEDAVSPHIRDQVLKDAVSL
jgi:predicted nucleotidyltransferase